MNEYGRGLAMGLLLGAAVATLIGAWIVWAKAAAIEKWREEFIEAWWEEQAPDEIIPIPPNCRSTLIYQPPRANAPSHPGRAVYSALAEGIHELKAAGLRVESVILGSSAKKALVEFCDPEGVNKGISLEVFMGIRVKEDPQDPMRIDVILGGEAR